jgi:heat shock protein HslJ
MQKQGRVALALAVVAVVGLFAVAMADARPLRVAGEKLWGHHFEGITVEDARGKEPPFADVHDIYVDFSRLRTKRGAQRWIGFEATCNSMGARIRLTPSRIQVHNVISTLVGCAPPSREREDAWLISFFEANPRWRLRGKHLILTSGPKTLRLREK